MKNYFDIIQNVSNMRWAITDREPTSFAEVQQDVKQAITQAHSYIWSLDDFPFKIRKDALTINKGQTAILAPKGTLLELWIDGSNSYMEQISSKDADFLSAQTVGMPTKYWVDFGEFGAQVHLYPTPDKPYVLLLRYVTNYKAKSFNGELKFNLSDMDDVLNLPDDKIIEDLYLHCLNTKAMEYLIADTSDENYQPYQKEFLEAYKALLQLTGVKIEPRLLI